MNILITGLEKISKEEACIYVKSFDQIDKIIVGVNNIDQLKKNKILTKKIDYLK